MQEAEALGTAAEDEVVRPHSQLLVGRHISDVLKPDVYLGGDKAFVSYVNARINVCYLLPLSLAGVSVMPATSQEDAFVARSQCSCLRSGSRFVTCAC